MVSLLRGLEAQPAFRADENYRRMHPADHRAIMRSDSPDCQYQTWQRGELLPARGLAGLAERGVAIPSPGDYMRVWRALELERSGKLSYTDTLSTELAGSTTPAAVILFVAFRLRMRWSELGGWYAAEMADTRLHPRDCACWN